MNLYLHDDLKKYFSTTTPLFDQLMNLRGEAYRQLEGRKTQRVQIGDRYYFIKQHRGVGWKEIFKNIWRGRFPVISAENEKAAIEELSKLGIPVPKVMGYGQRGSNPAKLESFILLEELAPTRSLEDICRDWRQVPPIATFKRQLISEVARIVRLMHQHGVNHRDCYICHFLLAPQEINLKLYLIDLHRAQVRRVTPYRWLIKDLAGLYFSSKKAGLTRGDYYRFICQYRNKSLTEIMQHERSFWERVIQRGEQIYAKHGHTL